MTTGDVLRQAAQEVRKGWCRGERHDLGGSVCAVGAFEGRGIHGWVLLGSAEDRCPDAIRALASVLPCYQPPESQILSARVIFSPERLALWYDVARIVEWNNARDQTAENVALAFEFAALLWDHQHALPMHQDAVSESPDHRDVTIRA